MPILNHRFRGRTLEGEPVPSRLGLQRFGPRVPVLVGVHSATAKSRQESEGEIPVPIQGEGLIDTGASITSVDLSVATKLGLAVTGTCKLGTAGGPQEAPTYAFRFNLSRMLELDCPQGVGCDLQGQGIILLIGMDLLSRCLFVMNGPDGSFTLSM